MNALVAAVAFLLAFLPLVLFHELGHYVVARLCGVHVQRFSIGFGKPLWRYRRHAGATEWVLAPLPLGGYVTLYDSRNAPVDPGPAQDGECVPTVAAAAGAQDLACRSPWQRMAISAAGPAANLLIAVLMLGAILVTGSPELAAKVRAPDAGSAADIAGLRGGDVITAVGSRHVRSWGELRRAIDPLLREGREARLSVTGADGHAQRVVVLRAGAAQSKADSMHSAGLQVWRSPVEVLALDPKGPAAKGGLREGDVVVAMAGRPIRDGGDLIGVRMPPGRPLTVTVRRGDALRDLVVVPERDAQGNGLVRIEPGSRPEFVRVRYGIADATVLAIERSWDMLVMMATVIGHIVAGAVSLGALTGPVGIAQEAGRFLNLGPAQYVTFAAALSLNLALVNMLPIATLDGGAIVGCLLEVVRGRPPAPRALMLARFAGMFLLALLFGIATFNDLGRVG